jgi:hypothetical protein
MSPTLIGLAGLARSGKGSCADAFREEASAHGLNYKERLLSGAGKRHLAQIFQPGISEDQAIAFFEKLKDQNAHVKIVVNPPGGPVVEEVTIRRFMQQGIQDLRENYGEDFWTDILLPDNHLNGDALAWQKSFCQHLDQMPADICVVSDVRQVNEANRIRSLGGVVIQIDRPMLLSDDEHITERGLPEHVVNYTLVNDVDLLSWRQGCKNFFNQTLLPKLVNS